MQVKGIRNLNIFNIFLICSTTLRHFIDIFFQQRISFICLIIQLIQCYSHFIQHLLRHFIVFLIIFGVIFCRMCKIITENTCIGVVIQKLSFHLTIDDRIRLCVKIHTTSHIQINNWCSTFCKSFCLRKWLLALKLHGYIDRLTVRVYFRACDSQTICCLGICGVIFFRILSRLSIFRWISFCV